MGINYEIGCTNCSFNSFLKSGTNSDFTPFENILKTYGSPQKRTIKRILKKYDLRTRKWVKNPRYEKNPFSEVRIYKCRVCGNIESQLYIRINVPEKWMFDPGRNRFFTDKDVIFRTINKCSKCGTRLRHLRVDVDKLKCPDCKSGELKVLSKKIWN